MAKVNPDKEYLDSKKRYIKEHVNQWYNKETSQDERERVREERTEYRDKTITLDLIEKINVLKIQMADLISHVDRTQVATGLDIIPSTVFDFIPLELPYSFNRLGFTNREKLLKAKSRVEFDILAEEFLGTDTIKSMEIQYQNDITEKIRIAALIDEKTNNLGKKEMINNSDGVII